MKCDRCKVELEGDFYVLNSLKINKTKTGMYALSKEQDWKLCSNCYNLVSRALELGLDACILYAGTSRGESID